MVRVLIRIFSLRVARIGEGKGVCRVLLGKPEGRRPMGRPRRIWVDNIRIDLITVQVVLEDKMNGG